MVVQQAHHSPLHPALSGVLVLDKPAGISSMKAVAIIRRRAGGVKTGHAGTLDPLATGVLAIALGKATKLIPQLMDTSKRYTTEIDFSAFTATDDLEGDREEVEVKAPPTRELIDRIIRERFTGEFLQRPPAFSAVKVGGRRAYKMARRGQDVEIAPRTVTVYSNEIIACDWPTVTLNIHCAKGFYVRSLARELGMALGTGGHCRSIRRTGVGPFTLAMAKTIEELPEVLGPADLLGQQELISLLQAD
jgi:tRNA pseudouridine55 synthase